MTAPAPDTGNLFAALALRDRGFAVFPLASRGKAPLIAGGRGVYDATRDPVIICQWWTEHPAANVGIACGKASGIVVVDIDPRNGGNASMAALEDEWGGVPPTLTVVTGGDGRHLYYAYPPDGCRSGKLADGIDVQSDGKYVVAPPSIHESGKAYRWQDAPLAELPGWVVDELDRPDQPANDSEPNDAADTFFGAAFRHLGWLGPKRLADGKRAVRCPWFDTHTPHKPFDGSTALFPARADAGLGGFDCKHSHCAGKTWQDVRAYLWEHQREAARAANELHPAPEPPKPEPKNWPRPSDLVLRLGGQGPKLPTGFDAIDTGWRGGALMGGVWAIGGAPGAGKTTLVTQLAHRWALGGTPVAMIASDEPREGVLHRLGQQLGLERDHLEAGQFDAKTTLAAHLEPLPLLILDPDEDDGADLETAARWLRATYPDGPAVLIGDSIQTLAGRVPDKLADSMRGKVDLVLGQAKTLARTLKIFVVLLSELSRAAYKFRGGESNVEDIAAGKESGGIEYAVTALTILRSVPKSNGLVRVTMPKSRLGRVEPFGLRQSYTHAQFDEATLPEDGGDLADNDEQAEQSAIMGEVLACIRETPDVGGAQQIGAKIGKRKEAVLEALRELEAIGRLVRVGYGRWLKWAIPPQAEVG